MNFLLITTHLCYYSPSANKTPSAEASGESSSATPTPANDGKAEESQSAITAAANISSDEDEDDQPQPAMVYEDDESGNESFLSDSNDIYYMLYDAVATAKDSLGKLKLIFQNFCVESKPNIVHFGLVILY